MNRFLRRCFVLVLGFLALARLGAADAPAPVYELRIYTTNPGKMPALLTRFREHTCAIFTRLGMVNIGYWIPTDPAESHKLYYVLRHASREAAAASWKTFLADPEWQQVYKASEVAGPLVNHVESIYMTTTGYSPTPTASSAHVYELRTYTTNDGKLPALDARFREHTMRLFALHGMVNLMYWHPTDADKGAGQKLIYLLAHSSQDAAKKSWDEFRADPNWQAVKNASEKDGLLLVHAPESVFMTPTDFSPLQ